jgi:hypothetical protein
MILEYLFMNESNISSFEKAFASHDKKLDYFKGKYFVELHSGKTITCMFKRKFLKFI